MKTLLFICVTLLMSLSASGQIKGFYKVNGKVIDTVKIYKVDDYFNSTALRLANRENSKHEAGTFLYPNQVEEYELEDGRVFISKEIQESGSTRRVFLERIMMKEHVLYYYKKSKKNNDNIFFIEQKDGSLKEISKTDKINGEYVYRKALAELTDDCPELEDNTKILEYNRIHFVLLAKQYETCKPQLLPRIRYGARVGFNSKKLMYTAPKITSSSYSRLEGTNITEADAFSFGGFVDIPISYSNFSTHVEFLYVKQNFRYIEPKGKVYHIDTEAMNIPVLIRYTLPSNKIRPFINGGLEYSYFLDWKERLRYIESNSDYETMEFSASRHQFGLSMGGGIEYKVHYKRSVFFDIRYTKFMDSDVFKRKNFKSEMRNKSSIELTASVNI